MTTHPAAPGGEPIWRPGPEAAAGSAIARFGRYVVSGFAGSAPTTEMWAGEISAPLLGVALEAWNTDGQPVTGEVGELVVTQPMPSMPLSFWNDPDGARYRDAYFSAHPGVWRHGDWMLTTERGSVIISGRSDSTLNRHGVRLGSADIYDVVDKLPQVSEALVNGAELGDGAYWLVLFIVLADRAVLTGELTRAIKAVIAAQASPRHVPDDIIAVPAIPHTRTGKKLEIPVKRLIQGHPLDQVASRDAVDDYDAQPSSPPTRGANMEELREALSETISLYLFEPGDVKHVELEDEPGSVTEHRMLARTA